MRRNILREHYRLGRRVSRSTKDCSGMRLLLLVFWMPSPPLIVVGGLAMQAAQRWRPFKTSGIVILLQYDHAVRLGLSDFEHKV